MKNIDKEELNILENQQIEEYQLFKAEVINIKENIENKNENYKVKEIENVSTFDSSNKEVSSKKVVDTNSFIKKIRSIIFSVHSF